MGAKGRLRKNPLRDKIPRKIPYLIQSIAQQIKHFFYLKKILFIQMNFLQKYLCNQTAIKMFAENFNNQRLITRKLVAIDGFSTVIEKGAFKLAKSFQLDLMHSIEHQMLQLVM